MASFCGTFPSDLERTDTASYHSWGDCVACLPPVHGEQLVHRGMLGASAPDVNVGGGFVVAVLFCQFRKCPVKAKLVLPTGISEAIVISDLSGD